MEFDNGRALLLIELYRRHRVLWDPKHPLYYSKARKSQAWAEVAARVGGPILDIRRKMESLLGSFRRERARARRGWIGPRGKFEPYLSPWFAYDQMRFLIGRDNPKKPRRLGRPNPPPQESHPEQSEDASAPLGTPEVVESYEQVLHSTFGEALLEVAPAEDAQVVTEPAETREEELPAEVKPSAMVLPRKSARRITRLAAREDLRTIAGKSWRNLRISARSKSHRQEEKSARISCWKRRRTATKITSLAPPTVVHDEAAQDQITRITSSSGPKLEPQTSPPRDFINESPHRLPRAERVEFQDVPATFGAYVSSKLRGYSPRTRAIVEHLISNVLFEADMGKYDSQQETFVQLSSPLSTQREEDGGENGVVSSRAGQSTTGSYVSPLIVTFHEPSTTHGDVADGDRNENGGTIETIPLHMEATVKEEPLQMFESGDEFSIDD